MPLLSVFDGQIRLVKRVRRGIVVETPIDDRTLGHRASW
jgi:hypothetical protein